MVGVSELRGTIARSDPEDMEFIGIEGIIAWMNSRTPPM